MIKSFRHKGLRRFYETGSTAGIQAAHAKKIRLELTALDTATTIDDMAVPGFQLHRPEGRSQG
jgi:proteic killer suppression protein